MRGSERACSSVVERLTADQQVHGSNPCAPCALMHVVRHATHTTLYSPVCCTVGCAECVRELVSDYDGRSRLVEYRGVGWLSVSKCTSEARLHFK